MSRRLAAALLTLVVAGAQASLAACAIACVTRDIERSAESAVAHSCHRTQPSDGPIVDAGVRICSHDEDLPAAAQPAGAFVPAVVASPVILSIAGGAMPRGAAAMGPPPGPPGLRVPLRI